MDEKEPSVSEPEMILEPTGITEDAIRRASGTRRSAEEWIEIGKDPNTGGSVSIAPVGTMPPVLPEGALAGADEVMSVQEQREYLEEGLKNLNRVREMLHSNQAKEGASLARKAVGDNVQKLTDAMQDPSFRQGMSEMADKFSQMREAADLASDRMKGVGRAYSSDQGLMRNGPGRGASGYVKPGGGAAEGPRTAAQQAAKARARNAAKAARAMRKKNRRK